jgi:hypothetical protein
MDEEAKPDVENPSKPKRKARDNPWYRLATLYGEPDPHDPLFQEKLLKNRMTWNRWVASLISEEQRAALIDTKRFSAEELTPLSDKDAQDVLSRLGVKSLDGNIDFSYTECDSHFIVDGFLFPNANFRNATFSGYADFVSATFSGYADFRNATFSADADFLNATFSGDAAFGNVTFSGYAYFRNATFSGYADFLNATFSGYTDFGNATFSGYADFGNAEMKAATSFNDVKFTEPPRFFNAKLHEGTTWHGVDWPKTPKDDASRARAFCDAYERL